MSDNAVSPSKWDFLKGMLATALAAPFAAAGIKIGDVRAESAKIDDEMLAVTTSASISASPEPSSGKRWWSRHRP